MRALTISVLLLAAGLVVLVVLAALPAPGSRTASRRRLPPTVADRRAQAPDETPAVDRGPLAGQYSEGVQGRSELDRLVASIAELMSRKAAEEAGVAPDGTPAGTSARADGRGAGPASGGPTPDARRPRRVGSPGGAHGPQREASSPGQGATGRSWMGLGADRAGFPGRAEVEDLPDGRTLRFLRGLSLSAGPPNRALWAEPLPLEPSPAVAFAVPIREFGPAAGLALPGEVREAPGLLLYRPRERSSLAYAPLSAALAGSRSWAVGPRVAPPVPVALGLPVLGSLFQGGVPHPGPVPVVLAVGASFQESRWDPQIWR